MGKEKTINIFSGYDKFFRNKKVLITGHTGFKGSWLTQILSQWGARVIGLALAPHTSPNLFTILELEKKIDNYFIDDRNLDQVRKVFAKEKPEIVIHLAAQAIVKISFEDPIRTYETNVVGTANILQAIRETPSVRSAVIITSDKVYENNEWVYPYRETDHLGGHDPYSASKAAADIISQSFIKSFFTDQNGPLMAITRAGNVIGGGDWSPFRIIPDIIRAVYDQRTPVTLRSPLAIRPWQHVLEPLSGYLMLAKKLYEGEKSLVSEWNFGPDNENFVTVEEIVNKGINILGSGSYEVKSNTNFHESTLLKLDISKARSLLGWKPKFNLEQTLDYTFGWYRNFYKKTVPPITFTENQIKQFFNPVK